MAVGWTRAIPVRLRALAHKSPKHGGLTGDTSSDFCGTKKSPITSTREPIFPR